MRDLPGGVSVTSTAATSIGGGVALRPSSLRFGVAHHDEEHCKTRTDVIYAVQLERAQVKAFKVFVGRQLLYQNVQGSARCINSIHIRPPAEGVVYGFLTISLPLVIVEQY